MNGMHIHRPEDEVKWVMDPAQMMKIRAVASHPKERERLRSLQGHATAMIRSSRMSPGLVVWIWSVYSKKLHATRSKQAVQFHDGTGRTLE